MLEVVERSKGRAGRWVYEKVGGKYTPRGETESAVGVRAQGLSSQVGGWTAEEALGPRRTGMESNAGIGRAGWPTGLLRLL